MSYLNFKAVLALPKTANSAQTHKSISYIWIVWSTLYVYLWKQVQKEFNPNVQHSKAMQGFARPLAHAAHSRTISCWVVMHVWKMRVGLAHRQSVLGLDAAEGEKVGRIGLYSTIPIQYQKYYIYILVCIAIFVRPFASAKAFKKNWKKSPIELKRNWNRK